MDAVVLENVTKTFGAVRAVYGLSARVPARSIYGFLGPNGAGKTTTIRMMMDIICPDSGRIEILGMPSAAHAKERIGYMPEERGLYSKMSLRAVLSYLAGIKGMRGREIMRAVSKWLEAVELAAWADKRVEDLSKGMQQKLRFAAAVINAPEVLILDEPFSGLDPVNLDLVKGLLLHMREAGTTVILCTHVMEQAEKMCDFILLINKGEKVVDGTLDQIRSGFESDVVSVELDGDAEFVAGLPMVGGVTRCGRRLEIALKDGGDAQELLRALVEKARVRVFEVKVPSLHEIFVRLVGGSNA